jgi:hypothetical protein
VNLQEVYFYQRKYNVAPGYKPTLVQPPNLTFANVHPIQVHGEHTAFEIMCTVFAAGLLQASVVHFWHYIQEVRPKFVIMAFGTQFREARNLYGCILPYPMRIDLVRVDQYEGCRTYANAWVLGVLDHSR